MSASDTTSEDSETKALQTAVDTRFTEDFGRFAEEGQGKSNYRWRLGDGQVVPESKIWAEFKRMNGANNRGHVNSITTLLEKMKEDKKSKL